MQTTDNNVILNFATDLAHEAGAILLHNFNTADKDVQMKEDSSPVTIADKKINQLVIDRITSSFPDHGILAEEGSQNENRKHLWVCDPIDYTKGFIRRIPTAMFSLAYTVDGQSVVAVIFDPFQDKLFSAVIGQGAQMNGRPISVSHCSDIKTATVATINDYKQLRERRELFDKFQDMGTSQLIAPGNVFRSTLVASGDADAYIFPGKSAHDVAAAKLIVEEAGGKVTNLHGEEDKYNGRIYGAIVTNGHLHDQLVSLIEEFGPENYIGY
jgi:fructose-1,6-bisphosphatase/inositol monophosphatase family enzyme